MPERRKRPRRVPRVGDFGERRIESSQTPVQLVTVPEIRRIFREARCLERLGNGELYKQIEDSGDPNPDYHQKAGTESQYVVLYRVADNQKVAEYHWYVHPDGSSEP